MKPHIFEPEKYVDSVDKLFAQIKEFENARETIYRQDWNIEIAERNISRFDTVEIVYSEILNQLCRAICSEIIINAECIDDEVSGFFDGIRATVVLLDDTEKNIKRISDSSYLKRSYDDIYDDSVTTGVFPDEYIWDVYGKRIPRRWI
jgi:hypothetical protein